MEKKMFQLTLFLLIFTGLSNCGAIQKDEDLKGEKRNTHDHQLSDKNHYADLNNDTKFEHNVDYDHDAFLGKEEVEKFKRMSPEESKEKLGKLFDKIDKNHDKSININELRNWIRYQHKLALQKNVEKSWKKVNSNKDALLAFDELIENTIGELETWSEEEIITRKDDYKTYLKLMERNKKRFKAADANNDGKLDKIEYMDFLHPEESNTMRSIVIDETIEDLDKNGDKLIDVEEFIDDIYRDKVDEAEEPDWVKRERENFKSARDKNNDKVLDREEVSNWIMPSDFDHTLNEAKHLIFEVDANEDNKLSKEEVLDKYNFFVASQVTAFGQAIYEHDDL